MHCAFHADRTECLVSGIKAQIAYPEAPRVIDGVAYSRRHGRGRQLSHSLATERACLLGDGSDKQGLQLDVRVRGHPRCRAYSYGSVAWCLKPKLPLFGLADAKG